MRRLLSVSLAFILIFALPLSGGHNWEWDLGSCYVDVLANFDGVIVIYY